MWEGREPNSRWLDDGFGRAKTDEPGGKLPRGVTKVNVTDG